MMHGTMSLKFIEVNTLLSFISTTEPFFSNPFSFHDVLRLERHFCLVKSDMTVQFS